MRATNIRPTQNQKQVIAKIAASPTPQVAAGEISSNVNIVAARNQLMNLGIVAFADNQATLTALGGQIAVEEDIVDQSGQLTANGQKLAYGQTLDDAQQGEPMEAVSLLKELLYGYHNASR